MKPPKQFTAICGTCYELLLASSNKALGDVLREHYEAKHGD